MPVSKGRRTWSYSGGVTEVERQQWPGERLGLPENGPGSAASRGARLVALLLDLVLASLLTSVFVRFDLNSPEVMSTFNRWALLVWFVISVVSVSFFGFTAGKALLGMRVVRLDGTAMVGPLRGLPRSALTALLLPAAICDSDGRGLHDKLCATVVVRTR